MESPRVVVWGLFYSLSTSPASSTLFLSISLLSMVMLTTTSFTSPSDLALSIPKLTLSAIETYIADVRSWFIANRLMINDAKMVFLTNESANKAEINILSARDTTRPGP